jgi:hypothetical protein
MSGEPGRVNSISALKGNAGLHSSSVRKKLPTQFVTASLDTPNASVIRTFAFSMGVRFSSRAVFTA